MVAALCQATDLVFDYQPIKTTFQSCLFPEAGCSIWLLADAAHKLLQHHLALWQTIHPE